MFSLVYISWSMFQFVVYDIVYNDTNILHYNINIGSIMISEEERFLIVEISAVKY